MRFLATNVSFLQIVIPSVCLLAFVARVTAQSTSEMNVNCSALSEPGHSPDYEPKPRYSIERKAHDTSTPPVLELQISASSKGIDGAGIIRLACELNSRFLNEFAIRALIFDDKKAARSLALYATDQTNHGSYLWHVRARYELNRSLRQEFVEIILPKGKDDFVIFDRFRYVLSH